MPAAIDKDKAAVVTLGQVIAALPKGVDEKLRILGFTEGRHDLFAALVGGETGTLALRELGSGQ